MPARQTRVSRGADARFQMLRAFGTNTDYIPQCRALLDGSSNPYSLHFAASSLTRLLTENSLSPQARAGACPRARISELWPTRFGWTSATSC